MIRVFLADDHRLMREGLRRLIAESGDMAVVGESANGRETIERGLVESWDVLVLDLSLPGTAGIEVLRQLHTAKPGLPILILSMHPEDQYAARLLSAGAQGYLHKDRTQEELLDAIRKVAHGGKYITNTVAERLFEVRDGAPTPHENLSTREHQIFLLLAGGRTPSQIGEELRLSPSTVSTHLGHIKEKLGVQSNNEIVTYAHRHGLAV